jgi:hypothetical protein
MYKSLKAEKLQDGWYIVYHLEFGKYTKRQAKSFIKKLGLRIKRESENEIYATI